MSLYPELVIADVFISDSQRKLLIVPVNAINLHDSATMGYPSLKTPHA